MTQVGECAVRAECLDLGLAKAIEQQQHDVASAGDMFSKRRISQASEPVR